MATLKSKHKRLAVKRLAVFDRPTEVQEALEQKYGVEATLSQLSHYDPTNDSTRRLADKWEELFWETREAFVEEQAGIAVAHKSKRLRELEKMVNRLWDRIDRLPDANHLGAAKVMAEIRHTLKQVAKETGEKYTNPALIREGGSTGDDKVETLLERMEAMRDGANEYSEPEMA